MSFYLFMLWSTSFYLFMLWSTSFYLFMLWSTSFYLFMLWVVFKLHQVIVEELYGFLLYIWQTMVHQVGDHIDKQVIW